jgi:hypothetical protein
MILSSHEQIDTKAENRQKTNHSITGKYRKRKMKNQVSQLSSNWRTSLDRMPILFIRRSRLSSTLRYVLAGSHVDPICPAQPALELVNDSTMSQ